MPIVTEFSQQRLSTSGSANALIEGGIGREEDDEKAILTSTSALKNTYAELYRLHLPSDHHQVQIEVNKPTIVLSETLPVPDVVTASAATTEMDEKTIKCLDDVEGGVVTKYCMAASLSTP